MPRTNSAENHVYAVAEYADAIREGTLYPRWSASSAVGYGAPVYNYQPPGLHYLAGMTDVLLLTENPTLALRLVLVVAFAFAGTMTYVAVLRVSGAATAILAAMLYLYSPYIGLTAPHLLGDYAGVLTFALYPALLWSVTRLFAFRNPFDVLLCALIVGGLILVRPTALMIALVLCVPVPVWYAWHRPDNPFDVLVGMGRVGVALIVGAGLSAFFWLPALLEAGAVTWVHIGPDVVRPALTWGEIWLPAMRVDPAGLMPAPQMRIGWPSLLAVLAAGALIVRRGRRGQWPLAAMWHALYLLLGAGLLMAALTTWPESRDLTAAVMLCAALGGSLAHGWAEERIAGKRRRRYVLPPLLAVVFLLSAPVWLSVRPAPVFDATDDYARITYEQQGFGTAVLPANQPAPLTLTVPYTLNRVLVDGYREGEPVRIPNIRLTGEKRANFISAGSHSDRYLIDTTNTVVFDVLRAYSAGWVATLDGRRVALEPNPANGLMQLRVPPVQGGQLDLHYGATPPRAVGWLVVLVVLVFMAVRTVRVASRYESRAQDDDLRYMPSGDARLVAVVCLLMGLAVLLIASPHRVVSVEAEADSALARYTALDYRSDVGLEVIAHNIGTDDIHARAGDTLSLTVAWRTLVPLLHNYQVRVSLVTVADGRRVMASPPRHIGDYPSRRWEAGYYVLHHAEIPLANIPSGRYQIALELLICDPDCRADTRPIFFDEAGESLGAMLRFPPQLVVGMR
ncbi:MAG: hypothetical protein EA396_09000 [Anaerolineaceae bacterium]|nr:MAG: hypothetical protein EA396_09000 [Anaerolineaceae bacterium]